jgi:hypothetical protein
MVKKRSLFAKLRTKLARRPATQLSKSHRVLMDWESVYKDLHDHPLTQAKMINEQLLSTTNETIKKFEGRIDDFEDRIIKLEKRRIKVIRNAQEIPMELLQPEVVQTSKRKKVGSNTNETPAQIVKRVVADPHMSDHEKEIIKHIQAQNELDAQSVAEQFHMSRSNASLKLNKLHDWGYLSKKMVDKTVFYHIKSD